MKYDKIKNVESSAKVQNNVKKKTLNIFSFALIFLVSLSMLNLSLTSSLGISSFVKRVVMYWAPKDEDIGKIKFVNFSFNQSKDDGVFIVSSPFKNYFVKNITPKILDVYGLGDSIVVSPIDGKVKSIDFLGGKYYLYLSYGNVVVNLAKLDNVCVAVGEEVAVGEKIAVANDSKLEFSILCDGKFIDLPADQASETFFE